MYSRVSAYEFSSWLLSSLSQYVRSRCNGNLS
nr:MAG TPA: hypothetical protein [Bacteriophage sp.]